MMAIRVVVRPDPMGLGWLWRATYRSGLVVSSSKVYDTVQGCVDAAGIRVTDGRHTVYYVIDDPPRGLV
jgi:hypothetical protein